jgi:hypothetical protein
METNNNIILSIKNKTINGSDNSCFDSVSINYSDLEETLKSRNYSTIK